MEIFKRMNIFRKENPCDRNDMFMAYANIFCTNEPELQELILYDLFVADNQKAGSRARRSYKTISNAEWEKICQDYRYNKIEYLRLLFMNIANLSNVKINQLATSLKLYQDGYEETLRKSGTIDRLLDEALAFEKELDCNAFKEYTRKSVSVIDYLCQGMQIKNPYSKNNFFIEKDSIKVYLNDFKMKAMDYLNEDKEKEIILKEKNSNTNTLRMYEKRFTPKNLCKEAYSKIQKIVEYNNFYDEKEKHMYESIIMQIMLQSIGIESYLLYGTKFLNDKKEKDVFFNVFLSGNFFCIFDPSIPKERPFIREFAHKNDSFSQLIKKNNFIFQIHIKEENDDYLLKYKNDLPINYHIYRK